MYPGRPFVLIACVIYLDYASAIVDMHRKQPGSGCGWKSYDA